MDFWEGLFLGPTWSDSDMDRRALRGFYLVWSIVILSLSLVLVFVQKPPFHLLPLSFKISLCLGLFLWLGLPYLAGYYYRISWPLRLAMLISYGFEYYCILSCFWHGLLTYRPLLDFNQLAVAFVSFSNGITGRVSRLFSSWHSSSASIVSMLLAGIVIGLLVLLGLIVLVSIPAIGLTLIRKGQFFLSKIYRRLFFYNRR